MGFEYSGTPVRHRSRVTARLTFTPPIGPEETIEGYGEDHAEAREALLIAARAMLASLTQAIAEFEVAPIPVTVYPDDAYRI